MFSAPGKEKKYCNERVCLSVCLLATRVSQKSHRRISIQFSVHVACDSGSVLLGLFAFLKVNWLHLAGEVDKRVRFSCEIFSGFSTPKITKIG